MHLPCKEQDNWTMGHDQQVAPRFARALWGPGCCYIPMCHLLWRVRQLDHITVESAFFVVGCFPKRLRVDTAERERAADPQAMLELPALLA